MSSTKISFIFSCVLILVNVIFLYTLVGFQDVISYIIIPGLTRGIIGFGGVIIFAVSLTWGYVRLINNIESKK